MKKLLINLITFYQKYLSFDKGALAIFAPGGACRNEIRCSEYTKLQVAKLGIVKGLVQGAKRIWSCR